MVFFFEYDQKEPNKINKSGKVTNQVGSKFQCQYDNCKKWFTKGDLKVHLINEKEHQNVNYFEEIRHVGNKYIKIEKIEDCFRNNPELFHKNIIFHHLTFHFLIALEEDYNYYQDLRFLLVDLNLEKIDQKDYFLNIIQEKYDHYSKLPLNEQKKIDNLHFLIKKKHKMCLLH